MSADVSPLFASDGPFVSVYLDARSDQPQAAQQLDRRWRNARRELEAEGADDETLVALDAAVSGDHAGGDTLALIAAGGRVLLRRHLPEPPAQERDRWRLGLLPWVGPLVESRQTLLPHLVVLADRTGADIYGFTAEGDAVEAEVEGEAEEVQRTPGGGWSQRRFQQRQENAWAENAEQSAHAVADLAGKVGARLIALGGDVRAVTFLQESLPGKVAALVRVLESGQRAVDGGVDAVAEEVTRLVDTVVAEETVRLLQEFREERGQDDRAAVGPARVVEALQAATVASLLVHDDPDDDRSAWFGPEPGHVALQRETLEAMGVEHPEQGRLVDACIRAALGTGADVRVVPAAVVGDGLGAVLRHRGTRPG